MLTIRNESKVTLRAKLETTNLSFERYMKLSQAIAKAATTKELHKLAVILQRLENR